MRQDWYKAASNEADTFMSLPTTTQLYKAVEMASPSHFLSRTLITKVMQLSLWLLLIAKHDENEMKTYFHTQI